MSPDSLEDTDTVIKDMMIASSLLLLTGYWVRDYDEKFVLDNRQKCRNKGAAKYLKAYQKRPLYQIS